MRIVWNQNEERFEAQFSGEKFSEQWNADKTAAMDAGFKTTGAPAWLWCVSKPAALAKLREHRPGSGLTITKEALDRFNHLQGVEQKNAELKAWAKAEEKKLKKEREKEKIDEQRHAEGDGDLDTADQAYETRHYRETPEYWKGKSEITRADLPADYLARFDKHESIPQRRATPLGKCKLCGDNTYYPEEPDCCMWCEGKGEEQFLEELIA